MRLEGKTCRKKGNPGPWDDLTRLGQEMKLGTVWIECSSALSGTSLRAPHVSGEYTVHLGHVCCLSQLRSISL